MVAVLVTIVTVGGYLFLHICSISRYKAYRDPAKRINLNSVVVGLLSFNFCLLLYFFYLVSFTELSFQNSIDTVIGIYGIENDSRIPEFAVYSLTLSVTIAFSINVIQTVKHWFHVLIVHYGRNTTWADKKTDVQYLKNRELLKYNDFELLAWESMYREMPVSVTLNNDKVYIGYIKEIPNISISRDYLNILPLLSGYRNSEKQLVLNTDYVVLVQKYLDGLKEDAALDDDFDLVVKHESIISISLFNPEIYVAQFDE